MQPGSQAAASAEMSCPGRYGQNRNCPRNCVRTCVAKCVRSHTPAAVTDTSSTSLRRVLQETSDPPAVYPPSVYIYIYIYIYIDVYIHTHMYVMPTGTWATHTSRSRATHFALRWCWGRPARISRRGSALSKGSPAATFRRVLKRMGDPTWSSP